jgi:hypothetical protein
MKSSNLEKSKKAHLVRLGEAIHFFEISTAQINDALHSYISPLFISNSNRLCADPLNLPTSYCRVFSKAIINSPANMRELNALAFWAVSPLPTK